MASRHGYDLIVVGAGILGLAHALAGARRGLKTLVIDRDAQANGASVRNFGFVTVTGQERGAVWSLARRSARIWREIAPQAGIAIEQEGLLLLARRPEAAAVIAAFARTDMAEDCDWLSREEIATRYPMFQGNFSCGLLSHADLRVESRTAIPALANWLAEAQGVAFLRGTAVRAVETDLVELTDGRRLTAPHIVVCPGDDLATLFPEEIARARITRCQLQMLRLASPGWRLPAPVMSDLSLIRYLGYAALPEARVLEKMLRAELAETLRYGIHLIAVQSADGSLVIGDSHVYGLTPPPFSSTAIDSAIIGQFVSLFGAAPPVIERWTGTYASGSGHSIVCEPIAGVRLIIITGGTGASTSFALAEDVIAEMFGESDQSRSASWARA